MNMKLFDKDNNGSRELYEVTGTFYASTDFSAIRAELERAMAVVSGMVGEDVIDEADEAYKTGDPGKAEFVDLVRRPVADLAISYFSRGNLVSHDGTGRKIKADDNEKIPFEWMIDRDDREQRERFYRAMDALYSYLAGREDWTHNPVPKTSVITGISQVEDIFPLEGSYYCFYMLLPLMMKVQRASVVTVAGPEAIADARLHPDTAAATAMREYIVLMALRTAIRRWSLDIFPLSVARRFSPSYQGNRETSAASLKEMEWYLGNLDRQADEALDALKSALSDGKSGYADFPLVPENDPRNKYFTT